MAVTPGRSAMSGGSISGGRPTNGWTPRRRAAACCRSTTRSPGRSAGRTRCAGARRWSRSGTGAGSTAIPVGGSDWHRAGSDAPPGRPTTWVQCAGDEPADIIDGLRAGLVAISAERDGPVLLRHDGDFVAIDADGLTLAGPQGPCARVRGDLARLAGPGGPYRLLDATGATLAGRRSPSARKESACSGVPGQQV
jgi:hypothetical protein